MSWVVYDIETKIVLSVHDSKESASFSCRISMNTLYKKSDKKVGERI